MSRTIGKCCHLTWCLLASFPFMASKVSCERMRERMPDTLVSPFACCSHVTSRDFPNGELARRLSHLMYCSSWIGFMQPSVQYKDISQGNNNSDQWIWKNIIFIFKENVVHCIDTKLTKDRTYWVTCKIETKLDFVIVMYCKVLLLCSLSPTSLPVIGPSICKQTKKPTDLTGLQIAILLLTGKNNKKSENLFYHCIVIRAVAKISSCWVYVISRRRIVQIESSFGSIFLLFPIKVAAAHTHSSQGKSPAYGSKWQPCVSL